MTDGRATSGAEDWPRSAEAATAAGLGPVRHVAVTGSTNVDLATEARRGDTTPSVLVADHQTAGRGRLDRRWDADPGAALLVSFRLPAAADGAEEIVQAVGAAARAGVDTLVTATAASKWPNDVLIVDGPRPGKIAGVLAEFVPGPDAVVVGVGVNVARAPLPEATCIVDSGGPVDRDALLAAILGALDDRLGRPDEVRAELRDHSATLGRRVRVEMSAGVDLVGSAVDLDDRGRLVVRADDARLHVIATGDVVHLRPLD